MEGLNDLGCPGQQNVLKGDVATNVSHKDVPVDKIGVNARPHPIDHREQRLLLSVSLKGRKGDQMASTIGIRARAEQHRQPRGHMLEVFTHSCPERRHFGEL
jgi:hypothetical protein